jgi:hypothetical protein
MSWYWRIARLLQRACWQHSTAPQAAVFTLAQALARASLFLTHFSREFLRPVFESEHISIGRFALPARFEVLLAAVHLPSKLYWSNESQSFECAELARRIAQEEDRAGHQRTVLVGDMNMNPFQPGLVSTVGMNAVACRRIAERTTRTVQGRDYRLFYNPMWGHFGDSKGDTAGSYFYDSSEHTNYFWNVFDQVALRPELAKGFNPRRSGENRSTGWTQNKITFNLTVGISARVIFQRASVTKKIASDGELRSGDAQGGGSLE